MKLTKRKALMICRDLWKWLEKNPKKKKRHWVGWKKYGKMTSYCPCCEYAYYKCEICLLLRYWDSKTRLEDDTPCIDNNSPYSKWGSTQGISTRKKYARIIWKACVKELNKMKGRK